MYSYFFLLAIKHRKEKALSRALPPLVVLCTLYWSFCLLYLSFKRKKVTRPHHLYSWSYLRATLNTSLFSWFYYEILENKQSTFLYHIILWKSRQMERWPGWNSSHFTWKKIRSACGKRKNPWFYKGFHSYWRESDPWPPHYQCDALPTEPQ